MSSAPPPKPAEQRSPGPNVAGQPAPGAEPQETAGAHDRRDDVTNAQSADPGDADVNTDEQGRYGGVKQNTTHQGYQQDR